MNSLPFEMSLAAWQVAALFGISRLEERGYFTVL
jgi:hypothetical protein